MVGCTDMRPGIWPEAMAERGGFALSFARGLCTKALRRGDPRLTPKRSYLIFLPAMVVLSLPALELAVARTLTFSFLGFLVSLLPLFFSLDMGVSFRIEAAEADAGAVGRAVCMEASRGRGVVL